MVLTVNIRNVDGDEDSNNSSCNHFGNISYGSDDGNGSDNSNDNYIANGDGNHSKQQ